MNLGRRREIKCFAFAVVAFAVVACSTGIVPTEQGPSVISSTSGGGAFGNPQSVRTDQFIEANEFCGRKGMAVHETGGKTEKGVPFVRAAHSSLEFECVPRASAAASEAR